MTDEFEHESHEAPKKQAQAASTGNVLSVLESRQQMYTKALAAAKTSGDASKARRLDRQLKVTPARQILDHSRHVSYRLDHSNSASIGSFWRSHR